MRLSAFAIAGFFVIMSSIYSYSSSNILTNYKNCKTEKRTDNSTDNLTKNSKVKKNIKKRILGNPADTTFEGC